MLNRHTLAVFSLFASALPGAVPPVERVEGEGLAESGSYLLDRNMYLDDDNPFVLGSEGDDDLGEQFVLRRIPGRAPIYARADAFLFWSNNTGTDAIGEDDGWYTGGSVTVRWKQQLVEEFYLDTYAYQDAYVYDSDDLDFRTTEFGLGFIKNFSSLGDLSVYGRYEFLYVHSDNLVQTVADSDDYLHSRFHRLRLGAYKALYSRPNHLLSLSTNGSWDFDVSQGNQRRQQISARLAYTWNVTGQLRASAYYRASYRDYISSGRQDWNQYAGVEINYSLNETAEVYASLLYGVNDSRGGSSDLDYELLQGGLALGLRASF